MRKTMFLNVILLLAVLLSACVPVSSTGTQPPVVEVVSTQEPAAVETPVAEASPTPAAELVQATEPVAAVEPETVPAGATVYKIVPGESQVSYEVGETFFDQNNRFNLAVGVTTIVNGEITLDPADPSAAQISPITVDISKFTSDSSRRDNAIRDRWLESRRFPTATFTPTALTGLPTSYTEGQELSFQVTGDLTVREKTLPVTFDVTASLSAGVLAGSATTTISLDAFGVGPIDIAGMLKTEDVAKLIFNFVARP